MTQLRLFGLLAGFAAVSCGPAPAPRAPAVVATNAADGGTTEPAAVEGVADGGAAVQVPPAQGEDVPPQVGPLPGPPGPDPPGFAVYDPLPAGLELSRALWKIDGPLPAEQLHDGVDRALGEIARCFAAALPGGRLPMHLIIDASGRVVEVGAPLAEAGLRDAITCAQSELRMIRFPESTGETTVRLIVER